MQLVSTRDFDSRSSGSSPDAPTKASLVQSVERLSCKEVVASSSLAGCSKWCYCWNRLSYRTVNPMLWVRFSHNTLKGFVGKKANGRALSLRHSDLWGFESLRSYKMPSWWKWLYTLDLKSNALWGLQVRILLGALYLVSLMDKAFGYEPKDISSILIRGSI